MSPLLAARPRPARRVAEAPVRRAGGTELPDSVLTPSNASLSKVSPSNASPSNASEPNVGAATAGPGAPPTRLSTLATEAQTLGPEGRGRPSTEPARESLGQRSPDSGFRGNIDGASMADLVQMECLRGLTRAVRVTSGRQTGVLFFDQGQLVHAELGGLVGERAAVAMLGWEAGTFNPTQQYFTDAPTIQRGWQGLLLMAAKEQDDAQRPGLRPAGAPGGGAESDSAARAVPARSGAAPRGAKPEGAETVLDEADEPPDTTTSSGESPSSTAEVHFDDSGAVTKSRGEVDGLVDTAAYILQLAELIGEALGMPGVRAVECRRNSSTLLCCRRATGHVAWQGSDDDATLASLRHEVGLP